MLSIVLHISSDSLLLSQFSCKSQEKSMERYRTATTLYQQRPSFHPHIFLPPNPHLLDPPRKLPRADDAEISIFDANRYFNNQPKRSTIILEAPSDLSTNPRDSSKRSTIILEAPSERHDLSPNPRDSSASSDGYRRNRFLATPTASSEASWNSQSGLLINPPNSLAVSIRSAPSPTSHRRLFRLSCPCTGKKSVEVEEKSLSEPKTPTQTYLKNEKQRSGGLEKKDSVVGMEEMRKTKLSGSLSPKKPLPADISRRIMNSGGFTFHVPTTEPMDPARKSLEVFRPAALRISAELQRRASEDDLVSETSSDLFELESFSQYGSAAGILQLSRSMEDSVSIAASECYPPSEVSVEWSVTTAEGLDRTSVANFSECGELGFIEEEIGGGGGVGRRRGLLSCASEKAVNVGPVPERRGNEPERVAGMGKIERGNRMVDRTGISRSHSARMTRPIQRRFVV